MNDLSGLLVVSIEQAVAAPYVTGKLADAGARVIKIERPEGDFARNYDHLVHGESAYFVWLNRGKESVCLDLKNADDKVVLASMLQEADIFIQNLAPGAIDRLGFSPERLRAENIKLITVSISGYGEDGPLSNRKAYDLLIQAESGLSAITGNEFGPARVGVSVCDIACGMTAYQAVLEALLSRQTTGLGRHVSVSLFHALADWMNAPYLQYAYGDKAPERCGLSHPTIAPYGVFTTSDNKELLLAIQNEREWQRFCETVLGDPSLASDDRFSTNAKRVENRGILDSMVAAALEKKTFDEATQLIDQANVANSKVSSIADLADHPQNRFIEVDTPTGPVRMLAPGAMSTTIPPKFGAVPALGEHTKEVRREFTQKVS